MCRPGCKPWAVLGGAVPRRTPSHGTARPSGPLRIGMLRSVLSAPGPSADRPKWTFPASELPDGAKLGAIHDDEMLPSSNGTRLRTLKCSPVQTGSNSGRWNCPQFKWDAIQAAEIVPSLAPSAIRGQPALFSSCQFGIEHKFVKAPEPFPSVGNSLCL